MHPFGAAGGGTATKEMSSGGGWWRSCGEGGSTVVWQRLLVAVGMEVKVVSAGDMVVEMLVVVTRMK
nr:hypothetical protein [Tanacetum cinerariifolium]